MVHLLTLKNEEKIYIEQLTPIFAQCYCKEIIELVNIIPHIVWSEADLLSQEADFYGNKWNYSYIVLNESKKIIGILIAYFRLADEKHIFDSLYLHRLAISPKYQNQGIGTKAITYFIAKAYQEIPWLLNISAQTNDTEDNNNVIKFYQNVGFRRMYNVYYPNKTDILLLFEKEQRVIPTEKVQYRSLGLKHPRLSLHIDGDGNKDVLPVVYFASTNAKKREMVHFIFNNYNIGVSFVKPPIELIEPQIEGPDPEEERKLVSVPLKSVSRFINSVPYVIEDTMLFVEYFNRNNKPWELPGLDTKRWLRQMGLQGILDIMGDTSKRKAKFVSQTGAYIKSSTYCYGRGELYGRIADRVSKVAEPKYGTYPYFFHLIFIPDGADKTLAEMDMHEYAKYDYMRKSIVQMISEIVNSGDLLRQYTIFDYSWE